MSNAAGSLIREARKRHRLSQQQLAVRAGTTQSAISRVERGEISPTVDTLDKLLLVMGERAVLASERIPGDYDEHDLATAYASAPATRMRHALALNEFAIEASRAGLRPRRAR